jgi:hypothetical protein
MEKIEKRGYIACCLCGDIEMGWGNNVEPIPTKFRKWNGEGRCCKKCDDKFVIPYRIALIGKKREEASASS